ncbi:MAG: hypothetical protein GY847_14250 [Proteobacteria bacterium]|nr:hypothetical protein [Pseudomonadota bacterium]
MSYFVQSGPETVMPESVTTRACCCSLAGPEACRRCTSTGNATYWIDVNKSYTLLPHGDIHEVDEWDATLLDGLETDEYGAA